MKQRIHPNRIEVRLVANQLAEVAVDFQGVGQALQGPATVAGEAPVAGEIVVEDRFARVDGDGVFERADRFFELADALEAPAKRHGDVDVVGDQFEAATEREDCFAKAFEFAQRLAHQVAAAGVAVDVLAPALERTQGVLRHSQFEVALGLGACSAQVNSRFGRHFGGGAETEHDGRRGLLVSGRVVPFRRLDSIQAKCKPWAENADKFGSEGRVSIHAPHDELANTTRCFVRGVGVNANRAVTLIGASRNVPKIELSAVAGLAVRVNSAFAGRRASKGDRRSVMVVYRGAESVAGLPLWRAGAARNAFIFRHSGLRGVWRDCHARAATPRRGKPPLGIDSAGFLLVVWLQSRMILTGMLLANWKCQPGVAHASQLAHHTDCRRHRRLD